MNSFGMIKYQKNNLNSGIKICSVPEAIVLALLLLKTRYDIWLSSCSRRAAEDTTTKENVALSLKEHLKIPILLKQKLRVMIS